MAKRAYTVADELGIAHDEIVEKAATCGIKLKTKMSLVSDEDLETLRKKFGTARRESVTEVRSERKGGTVIRRRKAPAKSAPAKPAAPETAPAEAAAPAPTAEPAAKAPAPQPTPPPAPAPARQPARREDSRPAPRRAASREEAASAESRASRKQFREVVNLREQERIARQVTSRTAGRPARVAASIQPLRRRRRDPPSQRKQAAKAQPARRVVRVEGEIGVAEFARHLGAKAAEVQGKLMAFGTIVPLHQAIDAETAARVAGEFGFEVENTGFREEHYLEAAQDSAQPEASQPRPAVVTVMGHVDHGKTSLLDALRESDVVSGEAGGITQHIGAYRVRAGEREITFIDTPGHEAFTAMRARGAQVTDIVILVVAASEGIMPQTIEAIDHARAAGVPMVVAINKCDLPGANPQQARQRLTEHGVVVEEFGGDVLAVDISATQRSNLDKLLDAVALQAELVEPSADPALRAQGVVIEAHLSKGRGPVATVLVRQGTLRRGDIIVAGAEWGRVRTMTDERGEALAEAPPSTPVQVIGLSGVAAAGEKVHAVESERVAKEIIAHRAGQRAPRGAPRPRAVSLDELFARAEGEGPAALRVIIKADTQGSAEALRQSLADLGGERVQLEVLHSGVGGVTERDVQLAEASGAIIIGFHVRPDAKARRAAEAAGVALHLYQVIYEAIDEVKAAMAGLLPPTRREVVLGQAEVRELFNVPKVGTIAGSYVTEGGIRRSALCRLVRGGVQVYDGRFGSLKRFKDDAREVQSGFECGIGIENFNDIKVGDVIEAYEIEETPAEL
ncbi:MAG: translation initiation factor IF-2 [Deltaproteobacteria bacterium]|nr:translation initiation factor IF-2 [Deltaproteobacteria bacterium]